jgi:hypothetical protein
VNTPSRVRPGDAFRDETSTLTVITVKDGWAMCRRSAGSVPFVRAVLGLTEQDRVTAEPKTLTADDLPRLKSDDRVILSPDQDALYMGCCECGLLHRIEFSRRKKRLAIRFVNIGHSLPANVNIKNEIVSKHE